MGQQDQLSPDSSTINTTHNEQNGGDANDRAEGTTVAADHQCSIVNVDHDVISLPTVAGRRHDRNLEGSDMTSTTQPSPYDDDIHVADDDVEIVAGRGELPWTQVHDWVILSGVGPAAVGAYAVLKMHLNRLTGQLNPGTVRLAKLLGLSRADRVAALIRPLVEIGAVEVVAYGMPRRNRYIVHSMPPEDYEGPLTLGQWAKRHGQEITEERGRQAQRVEAWRNRRSAPVTPILGLQADQDDPAPVTPESGLQVTPESGLHVTPKSGLEPDEGEPDVVEPDEVPPPVSSRDADASVGGKPQEEEEGERNHELDLVEAARTVLRQVTTGLPSALMPDRMQAGRLLTLAADALRAGWSADVLVRRIGAGDLRQVDSVFAVLQHRLSHLGEPSELVSDRAPVERPHTMLAVFAGDGGFNWRTHQANRTNSSESARTFLLGGQWREGAFDPPSPTDQ